MYDTACDPKEFIPESFVREAPLLFADGDNDEVEEFPVLFVVVSKRVAD